MTKDDFPHNQDELESWVEACGKFNEKFRKLIKSIVYLYQIRDLVSTEQLSNLCETTSSVLKKICEKECNEDVFSGQTCCSVGELLNALIEDDKISSSDKTDIPKLDLEKIFKVEDCCTGCAYAMPISKDNRKHFGQRKVGCTNKVRIDYLVNKVAFLVGKKDIRSLIEAKDILEKTIEMQTCYGNYGGCECEYVEVEKFTNTPPKPSCFMEKEILDKVKKNK